MQCNTIVPTSGLSHFSEGLYRKDVGQIGILGESWHFRKGWFFQVRLENSLYKKYKSSQKKKKGISIVIPIVIYHFCSPVLTTFWYSLFVPMVQYILPNPPTSIFFEGAKFFLYLVASSWKISNFLWTFCIVRT